MAGPGQARAAASQTWPAFVLVTGLLLVGFVANEDRIFESAGRGLALLPIGGVGLYLALLGLVVVVTAILNLDTSVVFLTPVLVYAARARGLGEEPFLYGTVLMSNAASLILPGSNLTNLIVLSQENVSGTTFAARILPAWLAAVAVTAAVPLVVWWRSIRAPSAERVAWTRPVVGLGFVGVVAAAVLVLALPSPALPVLGLGIVFVLLRRRGARDLRAVVDPRLLLSLFAVSVALGALGRAWGGPERLLGALSRWQTAAVGALSAVVLNNLPAAVLLSSHPPPHARALLLGLDVGPNLAVTGSLSAALWLSAARSIDARPSIATFSRLGLIAAPLAIAAALGAIFLAPGGV